MKNQSAETLAPYGYRAEGAIALKNQKVLVEHKREGFEGLVTQLRSDGDTYTQKNGPVISACFHGKHKLKDNFAFASYAILDFDNLPLDISPELFFAALKNLNFHFDWFGHSTYTDGIEHSKLRWIIRFKDPVTTSEDYVRVVRTFLFGKEYEHGLDRVSSVGILRLMADKLDVPVDSILPDSASWNAAQAFNTPRKKNPKSIRDPYSYVHSWGSGLPTQPLIDARLSYESMNHKEAPKDIYLSEGALGEVSETILELVENYVLNPKIGVQPSPKGTAHPALNYEYFFKLTASLYHYCLKDSPIRTLKAMEELYKCRGETWPSNPTQSFKRKFAKEKGIVRPYWLENYLRYSLSLSLVKKRESVGKIAGIRRPKPTKVFDNLEDLRAYEKDWYLRAFNKGGVYVNASETGSGKSYCATELAKYLVLEKDKHVTFVVSDHVKGQETYDDLYSNNYGIPSGLITYHRGFESDCIADDETKKLIKITRQMDHTLAGEIHCKPCPMFFDCKRIKNNKAAWDKEKTLKRQHDYGARIITAKMYLHELENNNEELFRSDLLIIDESISKVIFQRETATIQAIEAFTEAGAIDETASHSLLEAMRASSEKDENNRFNKVDAAEILKSLDPVLERDKARALLKRYAKQGRNLGASIALFDALKQMAARQDTRGVSISKGLLSVPLRHELKGKGTQATILQDATASPEIAKICLGEEAIFHRSERTKERKVSQAYGVEWKAEEIKDGDFRSETDRVKTRLLASKLDDMNPLVIGPQKTIPTLKKYFPLAAKANQVVHARAAGMVGGNQYKDCGAVIMGAPYIPTQAINDEAVLYEAEAERRGLEILRPFKELAWEQLVAAPWIQHLARSRLDNKLIVLLGNKGLEGYEENTPLGLDLRMPKSSVKTLDRQHKVVTEYGCGIITADKIELEQRMLAFYHEYSTNAGNPYNIAANANNEKRHKLNLSDILDSYVIEGGDRRRMVETAKNAGYKVLKVQIANPRRFAETDPNVIKTLKPATIYLSYLNPETARLAAFRLAETASGLPAHSITVQLQGMKPERGLIDRDAFFALWKRRGTSEEFTERDMASALGLSKKEVKDYLRAHKTTAQQWRNAYAQYVKVIPFRPVLPAKPKEGSSNVKPETRESTTSYHHGANDHGRSREGFSERENPKTLVNGGRRVQESSREKLRRAERRP